MAAVVEPPVSCSAGLRDASGGEYHHWIAARAGQIERSFSYLGETGEVCQYSGLVTTTERKLSFWQTPQEQWMPNEEDVMKVAAGWSFDPSQLTDSSAATEMGIFALLR